MGFFDFFRKGNKEDAQSAVEESGGTTAIGNAEETSSEAPNAEETAAEEQAAETSAEEEQAAEMSAEEEQAPEMSAEEEQTPEMSAEEEQAAEALAAEVSTAAADAPVQTAAGNAGPTQEKLTPEQMAERKARQEELINKRDGEGMVLSYLIQRHREINTFDSFKSMFDSLKTCWLWVPMRMQVSKADAAAMLAARKQGKKYSPKDPVKMVPFLIKTKDGKLFYSSFTNRDEIPKELSKKYMWIQVPSGQCIQAVLNSPNITALVINPNSKSLFLQKDFLQKIVRPVKKPEQQAQDLASEPDTSGFTS